MAAPERVAARGRLGVVHVSSRWSSRARPCICLVNGRKVWFFGVFGDEWDFLAGRRLTIHDLLLRHGDHLVALPALTFRSDVQRFRAAELPAVPAALDRPAPRWRPRSCAPSCAGPAFGRGSRPPPPSLFVLFGSGSQDILIAFQITFSGALVLGLVQLLLADHDGPLDRRDALALVAGLGALLCSDVAIVMIAAVGFAALLRRRWRAMALHTLPLAVAYARVACRRYGRRPAYRRRISRRSPARFAPASRLRSARSAWCRSRAGLLAIMLDRRARAHRLGQAASAANSSVRSLRCSRWLVGALGFASMLGSRASGSAPQFAASSRYLHIIAALVLPALAVAADAIVRAVARARCRGDRAVLGRHSRQHRARSAATSGPRPATAEQRQVIGALPRADSPAPFPVRLHPTPSFAAEVTVGWLLDGARSGRIPAPGRLDSGRAGHRHPAPLARADRRHPRRRLRADSASGTHEAARPR